MTIIYTDVNHKTQMKKINGSEKVKKQEKQKSLASPPQSMTNKTQNTHPA
jgi:hypothetical protein